MKKSSILVVEDESIVAMDLQHRLVQLGYQIAGVASTGADAIEKASRTKPSLVLMDIMLNGGMDGVEAADRIRAKIDVPVIFLTAYSDDTTLQRAKVTEPFGYILKPFEARELHTAIQIGLYRHEVDAKLRRAERWFSSTLRSIGDAVIAVDLESRIVFMNPVAEQITGWKLIETKGAYYDEVLRLVYEDSRIPLHDPVRQVLEDGLTINLNESIVLISRSGIEFRIDDSIAPMRDENGLITGAVVVFRDATEQRDAEDAYRESQQRTEQSQRLETVGRLAGGIAHDFNNLMTVILGNCDLAMARLEPQNPLQKRLEAIGRAGQSATSLTRQLLAFSRKQILQPEIVSLNSVVTGAGEMLSRLAGPNVRIEINLDPKLENVKVDASQFEQVLLNLVVNARDAMPEGGKLSIETSNTYLDTSYCEARNDVQPGPYARLKVSDTGTGMEAATMARVFEPFFTTKPPGKGAGLGLSTVYGIVKQSGGHVEVESEPGKGATFQVFLPRSSTEQSTRTPTRMLSVRGGTETILLVEDEDGVRDLLKDVLENNGYTVLISTGKDAEDFCKGYNRAIDMLVTDIVMPDCDGREVARRVHAQRSRIKILFMSGYSEDVVNRRGVLALKGAFISKPFTPELFLRKIRSVFDRSTEPVK